MLLAFVDKGKGNGGIFVLQALEENFRVVGNTLGI